MAKIKGGIALGVNRNCLGCGQGFPWKKPAEQVESTDPSSPESGTESSILSVYHRLRSDLTRADKSLCGETIAGTKGLVNLEEKKKKRQPNDFKMKPKKFK